jgi:hypothetical protein
VCETQVFYRAVSRAELEDWRECGFLRPGPNSFEDKYLTSSVDLALAWWRIFESKGWYGTDDGGAVLRIEVSTAIVEGFNYRGDKYDTVGPAWLAKTPSLSDARISVEREWSGNETPT